MHKRFLLAASALAILAGCGGGGSGSIAGGGGGPIPAPEAAPVGSAKFTVDARTGEVKVEPISASRAAFSGNALSFTSSLLLSEGSPERRVLRVTAKNNTQETIGVNGNFKLLFTNFQNANTPLTDLRSLVQTTTVWGNGTNVTSTGGQSTATISGPRSVDYFEATDSLFAVDQAGAFFQARVGTVSQPTISTGISGGTATGPGFSLLAEDNNLFLLPDGGTYTFLAGGIAGVFDGDFSAARFQDINDIHMIRATGPDDFEAVIADNARVRKVERNSTYPNGRVSTVISGSGPVRGATFRNGVYYFSDLNGVKTYNGTGVGQIGLTGVAGYVDGRQENARFSSPSRLRWVGNSLFVADSGNHRIRQLNLRPGGNPVSPGNWWVSTVSGNGSASGIDGTAGFITHNNPVGLSKGPGESLFVADQTGNRIRKITPISNRFLDNFGDSTTNPIDTAQLINADDYVPSVPTRTPIILEQGSIAAGGTAVLTEWQFSLPEGLKSFSFIVTVEAEADVPGVLPSVSNTGSGTKGSALVSLRTIAGNTSQGSNDGSGAGAAFTNLRGICFIPSGDAFVTDLGTSTIRHISGSGKVSTILSSKAPSTSVDGNFTVNSIHNPIAISSNKDGSKLYFTESSGTVRVAELTGEDPSSPTSWTVTTIAGLAFNYNNTNGTGQNARFGSLLNGLVCISEDTVLVSDSGFNVIKKITKQGAGTSSANYLVTVFAGSPTGVAGYLDGVGTAARISSPLGMTFTKSGFILLADNGNNRVRRIDTSGSVTTFSGSGASGATDSTAPLGATFCSIYGVAAETSGYAYLCDLSSLQVRRLSPTGIVSTVAGTAFVSGPADGSGFSGLFNDPRALAVSPGGDVWVLEGTRIRLLQRIVTN